MTSHVRAPVAFAFLGLTTLFCAACVNDAPQVTENPGTTNNASTGANGATGTSNNGANGTTNNSQNSTPNNATTTTGNNTTASDWHLAEWNRRIGFELTPNGFEGVLSNFTALVRLDVSDVPVDILETNARFVSATGQTLQHEVVTWNSSRIVVWLSLPDIESDARQGVWLYWDTPQTFESDVSEIWAAFDAVYHFDREAIGNNSVGANLDLECQGCEFDSGVVSDGLSPSEVGYGWVDLPREFAVEPDQKLLVSAWYRNPAGSEKPPVGPIVFADSYCVGWQLALINEGTQVFASYSTDDAVEVSDPSSYCDGEAAVTSTAVNVETTQPIVHVAMIIDREQGLLSYHLDGRSQMSVPITDPIEISDPSLAPRLRIGAQQSSPEVWLSNGVIDEVFIQLGDEVDPRWIGAHQGNIIGWSVPTSMTEAQSLAD